MFKLDHFGAILFISFSYKKIATMFILWKFKKSIFTQKIQKSFCTTTKSLYKFKRNYLENYNDSERAVKTKNASFFMIFPNISFFHMVVNYWTGPLQSTGMLESAARRNREHRRRSTSDTWILFKKFLYTKSSIYSN